VSGVRANAGVAEILRRYGLGTVLASEEEVVDRLGLPRGVRDRT
jgi:hypothetical protein